jgi:hypothetical protein
VIPLLFVMQVSGSLYGALIGSATAFTIADFLGMSILPPSYPQTLLYGAIWSRVLI